jgi:large subunit ribosomal protein L24
MALQRLKKDDTVLVIAGRERGKTGKVLRVVADTGRVVVERINLIKRHQKARSAQQPGGIIEREAPMHASNVMLLCGKCSKPTRVSSRRTGDAPVRVCKRCGEQIG